MTSTEKRYIREIGEIFEYNPRYWNGWKEAEKEKHVVTVIIVAVTKEENGICFFKLMKIGKEEESESCFDTNQIRCSFFISPSVSRKLTNVG